MTTYCCYAELRKLGGELRPTAAIAKTFEKRRCTHQPAVSAKECLKEIIGIVILQNIILDAIITWSGLSQFIDFKCMSR